MLTIPAPNLQYRICTQIWTSRADFQNSRHHSAGSKAQLSIGVSMCFPESRSLHPEGAWRTSDQGLHEVFNESIALDNGTVRICQRGKKLEWASRAEFEFVKMRQLIAVLRLCGCGHPLYNCVSANPLLTSTILIFNSYQSESKRKVLVSES